MIEPFPSDWGCTAPLLPEENVMPDKPDVVPFEVDRILPQGNMHTFINTVLKDMPDLPPLPEGWRWVPDTQKPLDFSGDDVKLVFHWIPQRIHSFSD